MKYRTMPTTNAKMMHATGDDRIFDSFAPACVIQMTAPIPRTIRNNAPLVTMREISFA
jgi:hypothetical protein